MFNTVGFLIEMSQSADVILHYANVRYKKIRTGSNYALLQVSKQFCVSQTCAPDTHPQVNFFQKPSTAQFSLSKHPVDLQKVDLVKDSGVQQGDTFVQVIDSITS